MHLDIPNDLLARLQVRIPPGATELDALREILDAVEWLEIDEPGPDDIATSLALIDQSMADVSAVNTLSVVEASRRSCSDLGSAKS